MAWKNGPRTEAETRVASIVGGNTCQLRVHRGLSQKQLAEKAGCSLSVLSHIERGARNSHGSLSSVSVDLLVAFAEELETTPQWLLNEHKNLIDSLQRDKETFRFEKSRSKNFYASVVGERVRQWRESKKMTLTQLVEMMTAKGVRIDKSGLAQIERNYNNRSVSVDMFTVFVELMGTTAHKLLQS